MKLNRKFCAFETLLSSALLALVICSLAGCRSKSTTSQQQPAYTSPASAGDALQVAARNDDSNAIVQILGPGSNALVFSGDRVEDKATVSEFVKKYDRMHRWAKMSDGSQVLFIGADNYQFPIPLKQRPDQQWAYDTVAGKMEVLARRIGRNELLAMDACHAIAEAQQAYVEQNHDGVQKQYAQFILSSPGKQNGLYWKATANEQPSPLAFIQNLLSVDSADLNSPVFDGYTFRVLTAQGANAPGGVRSYLKNGRLVGGYAVIASPIKYRDSGIMTFLLGPDGSLLEKDLGPETSAAAAAIQQYNPDSTWTPAQ